jgi:hypothetical protein
VHARKVGSCACAGSFAQLQNYVDVLVEQEVKVGMQRLQSDLAQVQTSTSNLQVIIDTLLPTSDSDFYAHFLVMHRE